MNIEIIQIPYDSGYYSVRTGCGPDYFTENGLRKMLQDQRYQENVHRIVSNRPLDMEIGTAFTLNRLLAEHVTTLPGESFPLILSGNCNSCVGAIAGLSRHDIGVIWFDAHGDFNTPETTLSGFLDGMGLAMVTGRCWRALLHQIPGYQPVRESNVIQVGAVDLDAAEQRMFEEAGIPVITTNEDAIFWASFQHALNNLGNRVQSVYVHLDLDVLNVGRAKANYFEAVGGLSVEMVVKCLELIKQRFIIRGCGLASVDPACDKDNVILNAGLQLVGKVLEVG